MHMRGRAYAHAHIYTGSAYPRPSLSLSIQYVTPVKYIYDGQISLSCSGEFTIYQTLLGFRILYGFQTHFYVTWPFRIWMIMALDNFLHFLALSKISLYTTSLNSYFTNQAR